MINDELPSQYVAEGSRGRIARRLATSLLHPASVQSHLPGLQALVLAGLKHPLAFPCDSSHRTDLSGKPDDTAGGNNPIRSLESSEPLAVPGSRFRGGRF